MIDNQKLIIAIVNRLAVSDPMTALFEYHYGPQAGTFSQDMSDTMEELERILLCRVENGEDFEYVEREMGMAAIIMLALYDIQVNPELCPDLTCDQDLVARRLIEGIPYEGLD